VEDSEDVVIVGEGMDCAGEKAQEGLCCEFLLVLGWYGVSGERWMCTFLPFFSREEFVDEVCHVIYYDDFCFLVFTVFPFR
jgi:hypothetical protein